MRSSKLSIIPFIISSGAKLKLRLSQPQSLTSLGSESSRVRQEPGPKPVGLSTYQLPEPRFNYSTDAKGFESPRLGVENPGSKGAFAVPCFPFKGCSRGHIKSPTPFHLPFAFPALSLCTGFFSLPDNYLHRRRIISSPGSAFLFSAPCPGLPLLSEVVHLEEGHQSCWGGFAPRGIFFV